MVFLYTETELFTGRRIIRKLIPKYEEMHKILIGTVNFPRNSRLKILDLGIGSGQTALLLLKKYPNAKIDGFDISKKMVELGKLRLNKFLSRVNFFISNISNSEFKRKYDAVVSVLCIHHLDSKQKQRVFKKIYNSLKKNGIFVIGDIVCFDSVQETKQKELEWKAFLVKNLGKKEGNFWFKNYKEEDLPDSVKNQLKWLNIAGFGEVKCLWRHVDYAVFYGKKI